PFGPPTGYATGSNGMSVAAGDFNGDGKPEGVVSNASGVTTFINDGTGMMTNATTLGLGTSFPRTVRVADMNGDGRLDIVTGNDSGRTIAILKGNGNGTFQAPVVIAVGSTTNVQGMTIADFNGDGKLDVAASSGNGFSVLLNDGSANILGSGTFFSAGVSG